MRQTSRGKFNRPQRATAGFTTSALDGYGLRGHVPARPAPYASYPVLVHRLASLLHASFRPRLATKSLRFAITSPPSGCEEDFHLQDVEQCSAHTQKAGAPAPAFAVSIHKIYFNESRESESPPSNSSKPARSYTPEPSVQSRAQDKTDPPATIRISPSQ